MGKQNLKRKENKLTSQKQFNEEQLADKKIEEAAVIHALINTPGWAILKKRMDLFHLKCLEDFKDKKDIHDPSTLEYRRRILNKVEDWMRLPYEIMEEAITAQDKYESNPEKNIKFPRTMDIDR